MKNIPGKMNEPAGKAAVEALVKEHQTRLKSFIGRRVSNREDAEDILQDVFYQLIKAVENTADPIEQVTAWLYRVARNMIINRSHKRKEVEMPAYSFDEETDMLSGFSEILSGDDSPDPEAEYLRSLVWKELERALSELPPGQREAFELTELEGLPVKEVVRITGVSSGALLSRKHHAVKHLRKRLAELYRELLYY
ncbi:MAG: sigma-70 family RNA polymerase sigma factor [Tannerellaceae bacterium]|jgi:RNA polymerase sigma factor (sigma-70 family)|nr:sigma-70 family RNA polymerase sigma factor [Tannerellaceae bacterium]